MNLLDIEELIVSLEEAERQLAWLRAFAATVAKKMGLVAAAASLAGASRTHWYRLARVGEAFPEYLPDPNSVGRALATLMSLDIESAQLPNPELPFGVFYECAQDDNPRARLAEVEAEGLSRSQIAMRTHGQAPYVGKTRAKIRVIRAPGVPILLQGNETPALIIWPEDWQPTGTDPEYVVVMIEQINKDKTMPRG